MNLHKYYWAAIVLNWGLLKAWFEKRWRHWAGTTILAITVVLPITIVVVIFSPVIILAAVPIGIVMLLP